MKHPLLSIFPVLGLLAACHPRAPGDARIEASVIGSDFTATDPDRDLLAPPVRARLAATAQGLVRYDADGQIVPGLAQRWIVSDDGLSYIFRLDHDADAGGHVIDARIVARRLRHAIARPGANPLKPILGAVEQVNAITNEVVEIRLSAPRPNLLQLLAQPELAVPTAQGGGGPLTRMDGNRTTLLLAADPRAAEARRVLLHAEPAALAVARFAAGRSQVVLGGTTADFPLVAPAKLRRDALVIDDAEGLFGLAFLNHESILGDPAWRAALSAAIDRSRLVKLFGTSDWPVRNALVPDGLDDLPAPASGRAPSEPVRAGDAVPILRVALPNGPAGTLIAAALAADWRALGVGVVRVGADAAADMALIDEVAPADTAAWYLRRFTCDRSAVCDAAADDALRRARTAPTLAERSRLLAAADMAMETALVFIPIARPLRWSLIASGQQGVRPNARAVHPIEALIADPSHR